METNMKYPHFFYKRSYLAAANALAVPLLPSISLANTIEETIVTADFRDIKLQKMPASVTVMTADDIESRSAQHLEQLLALAPNVNFSSGGSRTRYVQIRGIGERSQFSSPINPSVGTIIDGVDFSGIGSAGTLFDVERVEILRGPQGTRYGANALAGIIAITSTAPSEDFNGYVESTLGNYDTWSLGAASGGTLTDGLLYRASIQQYKSDGYVDNTFLDKDDTNGFDELTVRTKLRWLASDNLTVDTSLFLVDIDNGYDAFSLDRNGDTLSDEPGHDRQETAAISVNADWSVSSSLSAQFIASYADSDLEYGYDEDWSYVGIAPADEYSSTDNYIRDRKNSSLEARLLSAEDGKIFSDSTDWLVGIYFEERDVDLLREYTFADGDFFSNYQTQNLALFIETTSALSDTVNLTIGLRAEQWNADYKDSSAVDIDTNENLYGGKVVVDYQASDDNLLYASIARGYKAGGVNTDGTLNASDREFDTEYQWAYEVGIKSSLLDNSLQTRVAAFYNDRQDVQIKSSIVPVGGPGEFVDYINNAAEGSNYGLEIESVWQATNTLQLFANAGLLRTDIDQCDTGCAGLVGRDQPHAPRYQYSAGAKFDVSDNVFVQLDIEAKDEFYFSSSHDAKSESYELLNAKIGYETDAWSLALWGRNLTDEEVETRGFRFGNDPRDGYTTNTYVQLGEPRIVGLTGRYKF
jgi:outer membrane receptor protein involved in Fe transport